MSDDTNQPAAAGSGSNKWLYIVVGVVLVLAVLGFLGRMSGSMMTHPAGANDAIVPRIGEGSPTFTSTNGEGSVTVGGNKMPDNWPSDAPQPYAGATIQYSGSSNPSTGKAGSAVVYSAKASAADVIGYYKTQLTAQGWNVEATANMGASSVLSAKKDTRTIGISVVDAGDGSVQVSAGLDI